MLLQDLRNAYPIGAQRPLLVTEVTMMNGYVCVASLDIHTGAIARPLNLNGDNWETQHWHRQGIMQVGNVLNVTVAGAGRSGHPHKAEDMLLAGTINLLGSLSERELYDICCETADHDVETVYGGCLAEGKYVPEGTVCRSLGCVLVDPEDIELHIPYDRLRVRFHDAAGDRYDPAVTEMKIRDAGGAEQQLAALQARLDAYDGGPVALRLGLTRAWAGREGEFDPKRCTLQLNGIVGPA